MFSPPTFLSLFLVASISVDASLVNRSTGKVAIRFVNKAHEHGPFNIVEMDSARAQAMSEGVSGVNTTNVVFGHTAELWVGDPAANYSLFIDTGSANTWVGAGKPYVPTKTSRDTGKNFSLVYGGGNVTGEEWNDTVSFTPSLVIEDQGIGAANSSYGFDGVDGILGLGPPALTNHTVRGEDNIPTVMNNLFSQGKISEETFGILFIPGGDTTKAGELTIGGYDDSVIVGPVTYFPLTKTLPISRFWGMTQSISYDSKVIMQPGNGFVDTGSTLTYIASDAFQQYKKMTGAVYDSSTQLWKITAEQYLNLKPLAFNIGNATYFLTANAQIWPRSLNSAIDGTDGGIYLVVNDIGPLNLPGCNFIAGYTFLERFYSVYDATNKVIGFAETNHTYDVVN